MICAVLDRHLSSSENIIPFQRRDQRESINWSKMKLSDTTAAIKPSKEEIEAETTKKLNQSLKWGLIFSTANLVYGYLLVGSQLPPDPRQDSWLLTKSPFPTYMASVCYVLSVTWLGPKLMKNREPFSGLRTIMVIYNFLQVIYSVFLVWEFGMGGWFGSYNFRCEACDFSNKPEAIRMMHASYWYYFSKFVDFIDTIFFVMHKKYDHISLLHVSHHALMPVSMWYGVKYQAGGHNSLMGILNSTVHSFMYSYYCLAAMGPRVRPFLWWKKYLTVMQLVQFTIVLLHAIQTLVFTCPGAPVQLSYWLVGNSIMFLVLFGDFYVKSYKKKSQAKSKANGVAVHASNGVSNGVSNGISKGIPQAIPNGVSRRRGVPNGVADTACKTIELCEQMAFRSHRGAI